MSWTSAAQADWAGCQHKPTRSCLLEEAMRGDGGPIAGKDRLDVLMLTDVVHHPEYLAATDIDEAMRQVTSQPGSRLASVSYYFNLAATGLIGTNRTAEAFDLMPSLDVGIRTNAVNYLTTALVNADKLDEVPIFGRPMLADAGSVYQEAAKVSADNGKIELALVFMSLSPWGMPNTEMLMTIGAAYAKRGDPKMAARFYDRAQWLLHDGGGSVMPDRAMTIRFEQMYLLALRGDMDGVKAKLKELPPVSEGQSNATKMNRNAGYYKLINWLLRLEHPEVAVDVAQTSPEQLRTYNLLTVAFWDAEHGRLGDARVVWRLAEDKANPKMRGAFFRRLAVAIAKSGDVTSAIALAAETSDPNWHRAILFEIAQTLPP